MANYRTAMGKNVDMSALAARNEKTRAVGNMKVNARGDTIDADGKVVVPVTSKVNDSYAQTVGNRSAQVTKPAQKIKPDAPKIEIAEIPELTQEELDLDRELDDDEVVEQIKAMESGLLKGKK